MAFAQQFADRTLVRVDAGLEVVAGDFLQRQEAVALAAVFDEGRFQRGFEPGDAALVDVGLLLFLGRLFDIDVVQGLAVDDGHAQFFGLRGIDQHSLHCWRSLRALTRGTPGRSLSGIPAGPPGGAGAAVGFRRHFAQARRGGSWFPALQHHGGPRERFAVCLGGWCGPAAWGRSGRVQLPVL